MLGDQIKLTVALIESQIFNRVLCLQVKYVEQRISFSAIQPISVLLIVSKDIVYMIITLLYFVIPLYCHLNVVLLCCNCPRYFILSWFTKAEQHKLAAIISAEGDSEAATLLSKSFGSSGEGLIELRRIEAAEDIAYQLSKNRNITYIPDGQHTLLNLPAAQ